MPTAAQVLALTLGGVLGVHARYWLGLAVGSWLGTRFPWGTFLINVSGSFAIGLVAMVIAERYPSPTVRLGVVTGFLGGYTTFSSFMLESFTLWKGGERTLAVVNTLGSVALGLVAVVLGAIVGRAWLEPADRSATGHAVVEQRIQAVAETESGALVPPHQDG